MNMPGILHQRSYATIKVLRRMITAWLTYATMLSSGSASAAEPPRTLHVRGADNFPPYEYLDEGGLPAGFNVELIRAVAETVDLDIEISLGSWEEVRNDVEDGRIDLVMGMFKSIERDRSVDFSDPHTTVSYVLLVNDKSSVNSLEDLRNHEVAVHAGSIAYDFISASGISTRICAYDNPTEIEQQIDRGVCDSAILCKTHAQYLARTLKLTNLRYIDLTIQPREYCFAVREGDAELLAKLNHGLALLKSNGQYEQIYDKWLGEYDQQSLQFQIIYYGIWGVALLCAALIAALLWSWSLHRRIAQHTRALNRELHDRQSAEQAWRESNRFLETLIANLPGFVYRCRNDRDWSMEYIGGAFQEITGYSPDDLIDNKKLAFNDIIAEDHRDRLWNTWQAHLNNKTPVQVEYSILTADGASRWVWEQGRGVFNDDGELVALEGFICDISDLRSAEEERRKLELQLQQAQKMEAIGQLAGGVAHDFNNILTAILGNVELSMDCVRAELGAGHGVVKSMVQIEEAAQRASALTRQLLTFSRRDVMQPKLLNLNQILENLDKMLRRLITENIELVTAPVNELKAILADAGQIEQVIVNLTVNAVHAMPKGGRLTLETRNVVLDEQYASRRADVKPGPYVLLAVSDTGCGIDADTQERIFEPFFTTKPVDKGTGLGLATVHGIVKQSGGHVAVYSEPGHGATFKVYFPAVEAESAEAAVRAFADENLTGSETILLCEDDSAVRKLTAMSLTSAGYSVLTAGSGKEAAQASREHDGAIHLLITDVIMPDMNGRALSEDLRKDRSNLPTLFISGYTSNVIAHHGVLDDGVEFLEKPFTRQKLLSKVREVLTQSSPPRSAVDGVEQADGS